MTSFCRCLFLSLPVSVAACFCRCLFLSLSDGTVNRASEGDFGASLVCWHGGAVAAVAVGRPELFWPGMVPEEGQCREVAVGRESIFRGPVGVAKAEEPVAAEAPKSRAEMREAKLQARRFPESLSYKTRARPIGSTEGAGSGCRRRWLR